MVAAVVDKAAKPAAHFPIPNLVFENRSALDACQFDMVDQYDSSFHVIAAKTAYQLGPCDHTGMAVLLPVAGVKLNVEDRYFGEPNRSSVRQESDFAPYKPACDVIVNATAYVPGEKPAPVFHVRLTVVGTARAPLIDKTLSISGERGFQKKSAFSRMVQWSGKVATAGLYKPVPWRLSRTQHATDLPVRYEFASGGQCRIDGAGTGAKTHEASEENPCGRGFARRWYLDAKRATAYAGPRIHTVDAPFSAPQFWHAARGAALPAPVGFGPVGRGWLPRRALAGTFEDKAAWGKDDVPRLPKDFDFAYYNCAPRDQQCAYLGGGEKFSLLNLCSVDHSSATRDAKGNTVLQFVLPQQALFVLAADSTNQLMVKRLVIDTVIVEPDERRVDLVWRVLLPTDAGLRAARMLHVREAAQIARLDEMLRIQAAVNHGTSTPSQ